MLVVDASVAFKWCVDEPDSSMARRLLERDEALIAPELVVAEVCNAAWKLHRRRAISREHYASVCREISSHFDRLVAIAPTTVRAGEIARVADHAVYDAVYVAVAETEDARLVTADDALIRRLRSTPWRHLAIPLAEAAR